MNNVPNLAGEAANVSNMAGDQPANVSDIGRMTLEAACASYAGEYPVGPFVQQKPPAFRKACGCGRCGS